MAFEIPSDLMVSVSGVRGRVGESLTPELVARFAAAFGAYLRERGGGEWPRVVLGRDSRISGPMFARAATAGLQSVGCDVVDLGLVPTPTALFAIRHHKADGALVVTASHNPAEWNALKFASAGGTFLDAAENARLHEIVRDQALPRAAWDEVGDVVADPDAIERHIEAVLKLPYLDIDGLINRRFTVAVDAVRGAGALLLPPLLGALGCEVVGMHLKADGRFPRAPEPVPENLGGLERLVRKSGADIGFAIDPDGDRLAIVSHRGRAIGEDLTLALAASLVLRHRRGPVVTNLSTSRMLDDIAEEHGVQIHRVPVGEVNVARRMQAVKAVVGGEGNGGVILPDLQLTRDAAVAASLVLQYLFETGLTVEEHVARRRAYTIVKDKLPRGTLALEPIYRALETRLAAPDVDRQDGLRLAWPGEAQWLHLRPSGTEPVLRIIAEAPTAQSARDLIQQARGALEQAEPAGLLRGVAGER